MYQCDNWPETLDFWGAGCHTMSMKKETTLPDLSRLSDEQLENLEDFCTRKHRDELWDEVIAEMLRRPDFVASTHDLEYTLECWR